MDEQKETLPEEQMKVISYYSEWPEFGERDKFLDQYACKAAPLTRKERFINFIQDYGPLLPLVLSITAISMATFSPILSIALALTVIVLCMLIYFV